MAAAPMNIGQSTQNGAHSSTLAPEVDGQGSGMNIGGGQGRAMSSVFGNGESQTGALPISMNPASRERPRRESLAGSMVTGMSFGGTSVGSWIRDDIIMQGTSPFPAYQSPSYHSASYMPKLEANFMKDFACCGMILPSMHDLLAHYELKHSQLAGSTLQKQNSNTTITPPDPRAAIAAGAADAIKDQSTAGPAQSTSNGQNGKGTSTPKRTTPTQPQRTAPPADQTIRGFAPPPPPPPQPPMNQEDDAVGEMEMDMEPAFGVGQQMPNPSQDQMAMMQSYQIPQPPQNRVAPLDLNGVQMGPQFQQYRGLRNSTPTTPVSASRPGTFYQNNPIVSSVNTPTMATHSAAPHLQQFYTPDSSAPGTPGELDGDMMAHMSSMNVGGAPQFPPNQQFSSYGYGNGNGHDMADLYIDEPAKRLLAANGAFNPAGQPYSNPQLQQPQRAPAPASSAAQLGEAQYGENSPLAITIREQQKLAGVPDPSADGVPKPFHCPVIGCEKAYKNQNGLKYHKSHGHNSQSLRENEDGTFSIVDPETMMPFPGTTGMEKHKPYKCDACGKRYKNLNGLKYHKGHSPMCENGNGDGTLARDDGEGTGSP